MEKKNLLICILQVWGIILVVLGHSFYYWPDNNPIHDWIYSFHMPLFMFISGYLFKYSNEKRGQHLYEIQLWGMNGLICKKAKRLLVPYVVISSLAFVPKALLGNLAGRSLDFSFGGYIDMLIYPWNNVIIFFWFLPTIYIIFMIVALVGKMRIRMTPITAGGGIIILAILHMFNPLECVQILNISGVASYLVYFALGYIVATYKWEIFAHKRPFAILVITFVLSIALLRIPDFLGKDILCAFNGITLSIALSYVYINSNAAFINHLFGASYTIYLLSWFPQVTSQQILIGVTHAPWWIGSILAFFLGLYIPLLIFHMSQKLKGRQGYKFITLLIGI